MRGGGKARAATKASFGHIDAGPQRLELPCTELRRQHVRASQRPRTQLTGTPTGAKCTLTTYRKQFIAAPSACTGSWTADARLSGEAIQFHLPPTFDYDRGTATVLFGACGGRRGASLAWNWASVTEGLHPRSGVPSRAWTSSTRAPQCWRPRAAGGTPSGARLCQIAPEPLRRQTWHEVDTGVARRSRRRRGSRAISAMSTTNVSPSITRSVPVCASIAEESHPKALFPTCRGTWTQLRTTCERHSFTDSVHMLTDDAFQCLPLPRFVAPVRPNSIAQMRTSVERRRGPNQMSARGSLVSPF